MSAILPFKSKEIKHPICRSEDYMKEFCKSLKEHAMQIINH